MWEPVLALCVISGIGQIGEPEGKLTVLNDGEAEKWFVDDWGNPNRADSPGVNVSFVRWARRPPAKKGRGRIAIIQTGMVQFLITTLILALTQ
jgi:hypothetical protein